MAGPPAFQFYPERWLGGTAHLSPGARGIYIDLLAWSWANNKPLPVSLEARCQIGRCHSLTAFEALWGEIADKWYLTPAGYVNGALEQIRGELERFRSAQVEKGKKGAAKRWPGHQPGHTPGQSPRNGSPISVLRSPVSDLDPPISEEKETRITVRSARPQELADAWNDITQRPIPRCRELTNGRRKAAERRLRERPLDAWREVIGRIQASDFCGGQNNSGWVATFDWLLKPDTATKVIEGKYDNREGSGPKGRSVTEHNLRGLREDLE